MLPFSFQFREGVLHGSDVEFLQFLLDDRIVVPINEAVLLRLILDDTHLCVGIVLELEVVPVEVVGCDVEQYGNVGMEVIHVVELETAQFDDVIGMRLFGDLQSQALPDVSGQSNVIAGILEYMEDEACGRCLSIAPGDAYHLGVGVTAGKFNLADDVCALLDELLYHRGFLRYAWTLDDLVGTEYFFLSVVSFFPFDVMVVEQLLVLVLNGRHIRNEHVEALCLGKYGCPCSTFACS